MLCACHSAIFLQKYFVSWPSSNYGSSVLTPGNLIANMLNRKQSRTA